VPIASPAVSLVARAFRGAGLVDFSPEQMRYLEHGRVADVSRLRERYGWAPRPTAAAFADFVDATSVRLDPAHARAAEQKLLDLLARRRSPKTAGVVGA
jgi:UDP-glucose 4-epimerase